MNWMNHLSIKAKISIILLISFVGMVAIGGVFAYKKADINEELKKMDGSNFDGVSEKLEKLFKQIIIVMITILIIQGVFGVVTIKQLFTRLKSAHDKIRRISEGDLTIIFKTTNSDEIGDIARALDELQVSIRDMFISMVEVGLEINAKTGEVAATSEMSRLETDKTLTHTLAIENSMFALSEGAKRISDTINEISSGAATIADHTIKMAEESDKAKISGESSISLIKETSKSISKLASETEKSAISVRTLGERANQIQNFVSQISGIADQTNLLALNAAIEAARAGEAGKGFAVVAEEVRKLAEESNEAAKNISSLAVSTVNDLDRVLQTVENGAKDSTHSVNKIQEMEEAVESIISQIKFMADSSEELAAIAEEQAASCKEITHSVKEVSDRIGENTEATSNMKKELMDEVSKSSDIASQTKNFMLLSQKMLEKAAEYRTMPNEELADQMLLKIQAHKDFCTKLFSMADTCELQPIQINSRHCGLGVLMTSSFPPRGFEHWWEKIHKVHDEYHKIGEKIIQVLGDETKSMDIKRRESKDLAEKGKALSEVVIKLLEDAALDIRNANKG